MVTQKTLHKLFFLSVLLATNLFATTGMNGNAFQYYTEGIYDAIAQISRDIEGSDTKIVEGTQGKILVLKDLTESSFVDIVFVKAVAAKNNIPNANIIQNQNGTNFMFFGSFDRDADAEYIIRRLKDFRIDAGKKINNDGSVYRYNPIVLKKISDDIQMLLKDVPVKVIEVTTTKYIDTCSGNSFSTKRFEPISVKTQEIPAYNPELKNSLAYSSLPSQGKKYSQEEVAQEPSKNSLECLNDAIKLLKKSASFSPEQLAFQYNHKIYKEGDYFAHGNCSFKITKISMKGERFSVRFDNYLDNHLVVILKKTEKAEESNGGNRAAQKPSSSRQEPEQKPSGKNIKKLCNFDIRRGIRIHNIKNASGGYSQEGVPEFYSGKEIEVSVLSNSNGYVTVQAQGSEAIVLSSENFSKHCK